MNNPPLCVCFAGFGEGGQLGQGSNASIGMMQKMMGDFLPPIDLGKDRIAVAVAPGGTHTCAGLCATQKAEGGDAFSRAVNLAELQRRVYLKEYLKTVECVECAR